PVPVGEGTQREKSSSAIAGIGTKRPNRPLSRRAGLAPPPSPAQPGRFVPWRGKRSIPPAGYAGTLASSLRTTFVASTTATHFSTHSSTVRVLSPQSGCGQRFSARTYRRPLRIPSAATSTVSVSCACTSTIPIASTASRRVGYASLYDQSRSVYGPVSIPFTGFEVSDCEYSNQPTVMAFGRETLPAITGLW